MNDNHKLYLLFSEPLGSAQDWINVPNLQIEEDAIVDSVRNAPIKVKLAPGTFSDIRQAVQDRATILHLSCSTSSFTRDPSLILERDLDSVSCSVSTLREFLDHCLDDVSADANLSGNSPSRAAESLARHEDVEFMDVDSCSRPKTPSYTPTTPAHDNKAPEDELNLSRIQSTDSMSFSDASSIILPPRVPSPVCVPERKSLPFKIVFLNGSFTERFASCFLDRGVEHVICYPHNQQLADDVAVKFVSVFYSDLSSGATVYDAFCNAQAAVEDGARGSERQHAPYLLLPRNSDAHAYKELHSKAYFSGDRGHAEFISPYPALIENVRRQHAAVGCSPTLKSIMAAFFSRRCPLIVVHGGAGMGKTLVAQTAAHMLHRRSLVSEVYSVDVRKVITTIAQRVVDHYREIGSNPGYTLLKSFSEQALLSELSMSLHAFGVSFQNLEEVIQMLRDPVNSLDKLLRKHSAADATSQVEVSEKPVLDAMRRNTSSRLPLIIFEHASDLTHLSDCPFFSAIFKPFETLLDFVLRPRNPLANVISAGKMPGLANYNYSPYTLLIQPPSVYLNVELLVQLLDPNYIKKLVAELNFRDSPERQLCSYLQQHSLAPEFAASPSLAKAMVTALYEHPTVKEAWEGVKAEVRPDENITETDASVRAMCAYFAADV